MCWTSKDLQCLPCNYFSTHNNDLTLFFHLLTNDIIVAEGKGHTNFNTIIQNTLLEHEENVFKQDTFAQKGRRGWYSYMGKDPG